jgi:hypothetical protein
VFAIELCLPEIPHVPTFAGHNEKTTLLLEPRVVTVIELVVFSRRPLDFGRILFPLNHAVDRQVTQESGGSADPGDVNQLLREALG